MESFDINSGWLSGHMSSDETPTISFVPKEPIELDINDPDFHSKVGPAVDELTTRAKLHANSIYGKLAQRLFGSDSV